MAQATETGVERREDRWISVPATSVISGVDEPVELRPGADESKVRFASGRWPEVEITIAELRSGLSKVEEEHQR